jgi:hypothetical protein
MTDLSLPLFNRSIREPTMTCKPMLPPVANQTTILPFVIWGSLVIWSLPPNHQIPPPRYAHRRPETFAGSGTS